jgi:hypothetical protein
MEKTMTLETETTVCCTTDILFLNRKDGNVHPTKYDIYRNLEKKTMKRIFMRKISWFFEGLETFGVCVSSFLWKKGLWS